MSRTSNRVLFVKAEIDFDIFGVRNVLSHLHKRQKESEKRPSFPGHDLNNLLTGFEIKWIKSNK